MKEFEYRGIWWLPGEEENFKHGNLKYNSLEGGVLEIIGELDNNNEFKFNIILGKTSDGRVITLYKNFRKNIRFNSDGFPTMTIFSHIIFDGVHFNTENEIIFKRLSCRYSNLDEWAWSNNIKIKNLENGEINIKYVRSSSINADINDKYRIELKPIPKFSNICIVQKEASIKDEIYIVAINKKLTLFEEHRKILNHMQNLISLAIGKSASIIDLIGETESNKEELGGKFYYPEVKIYFYYKEDIKENYEQILPPNMLFSLRNIKDNFELYIRNWFNKKEILTPVFNLYFGTLYNTEMYVEQRFLSLIQALESYHRRSKENNEIDPEQHEKRVNEIIEAVGEQYKEWLKERLSYSNEPKLRIRLNDILNECGRAINIETSRKKKSFINKICDTRNYLTHYDISLTGRAIEGVELARLCNKLKVIIQFYFLIELGFSFEEAERMIKEKYKNTYILE